MLLATGVLTLEDIAKEGDVLATFIWFAVVFAISSQLNELGFMEFLGRRLAARMDGLSALTAGVTMPWMALFARRHGVGRPGDVRP